MWSSQTLPCRQVHLLAATAILAPICIARLWVRGLIGVLLAIKVSGTASSIPRPFLRRLIQPLLYTIRRGLRIVVACVRIASWYGLTRRGERSKWRRLSIACTCRWMRDSVCFAGHGRALLSFVRWTLLGLFGAAVCLLSVFFPHSGWIFLHFNHLQAIWDQRVMQHGEYFLHILVLILAPPWRQCLLACLFCVSIVFHAEFGGLGV